MILHICPKTVWQEALELGAYKGDTLDKEGFIHCSELSQVVEVANYVFKEKDNLLLLEIDPTKVTAEIKYEDPGVGEKYPHIYGPLNIDAVIETHNFKTDDSGSFVLPQKLQG